ncbi:hypothetical protein Lalb_Chr05g0215241 [Lupinus albus]|uniref:Uncharacterized protein n=1 Tax=Lupinus albus TaxID=3870 RepID=A0A6A4QHS0_LUPAL|nr:hypothetical protein Lalb_Chr05g0215241 [Lupinus albus]
MCLFSAMEFFCVFHITLKMSSWSAALVHDQIFLCMNIYFLVRESLDKLGLCKNVVYLISVSQTICLWKQ